MSRDDDNTRLMMRRGGLVVLAVGALASVGVYLGHDWFHSVALPALGLRPALGDALGGFAIILAAYFGQRLVSLMVFRDVALGSIRAAQQLRQVNQDMQAELSELDRLARTDKLTGAWNRRRLEESVAGEMERLSRYDHALSILVLDIDFFKNINDKHGHAVGDRVLTEFTARLRRGVRTADLLARWGGEEFVVLCPNTPLGTATRLANRLRESIRSSDFAETGQVTVSIGVAECEPGENWEVWFQRADAALYQAKHDGRDQVHVAPLSATAAGSREVVAANFVRLVWHAAYESGIAELDRQHRGLFDQANELLAALISRRPHEEIAATIDALTADVVHHFGYEEALLARVNFPDAAEHAAAHRQLSSEAALLVERFRAGALEIGELFQFLAHNVIARHILGADREFFPWLENFAETASSSPK